MIKYRLNEAKTIAFVSDERNIELQIPITVLLHLISSSGVTNSSILSEHTSRCSKNSDFNPKRPEQS